jgi:hypothetical protein
MTEKTGREYAYELAMLILSERADGKSRREQLEKLADEVRALAAAGALK